MAKKNARKYVVVRCQSAGVHVGELVERRGQEVTLAHAKRLWRWFGANTLHEVANNGVASSSKVSEAISEIVLTQAIEVLTCSPKSIECFARAGWGA